MKKILISNFRISFLILIIIPVSLFANDVDELKDAGQIANHINSFIKNSNQVASQCNNHSKDVNQILSSESAYVSTISPTNNFCDNPYGAICHGNGRVLRNARVGRVKREIKSEAQKILYEKFIDDSDFKEVFNRLHINEASDLTSQKIEEVMDSSHLSIFQKASFYLTRIKSLQDATNNKIHPVEINAVYGNIEIAKKYLIMAVNKEIKTGFIDKAILMARIQNIQPVTQITLPIMKIWGKESYKAVSKSYRRICSDDVNV